MCTGRRHRFRRIGTRHRQRTGLWSRCPPWRFDDFALGASPRVWNSREQNKEDGDSNGLPILVRFGFNSDPPQQQVFSTNSIYRVAAVRGSLRPWPGRSRSLLPEEPHLPHNERYTEGSPTPSVNAQMEKIRRLARGYRNRTPFARRHLLPLRRSGPFPSTTTCRGHPHNSG